LRINIDTSGILETLSHALESDLTTRSRSDAIFV